MAQMVCGSCRQLLSYPRGTRQAKCSCCETVNFVLEGSFPFSNAQTQICNWPRSRAVIRLYSGISLCVSILSSSFKTHEVGLVKCDSCAVLLMYPYGAPSVKCSSCHFVIEIGAHNRRPPWSVQQGQSAPPNALH
ncbi:hypothetical protein DITRI_Ditri19aG0036500 [Diplodiscus trichospermus]